MELFFFRVAINQDQIVKYDLPTSRSKPGDKRSPSVAATVEAEAMPAPLLRSLVRSYIEFYLPEGRLDYARTMDEEGQRSLRIFDPSALTGSPA